MMLIENSYSEPKDNIPTFVDHVYQSLDEVKVNNILGNPQKNAPTPKLKRRPLAERSNLPPISVKEIGPKTKSDEKIAKDICRSRKDRFLFWKNKSEQPTFGPSFSGEMS